jgi:glycosyltransferase involved in cell wall biosynthesis
VRTFGHPLVSVVTPVYNGAAHLAECIESVLKQTYQNWDYTIVDNCSTDESAIIARRYAAKDQRIRIVENEVFQRALNNHNIALSLISPAAKYCKVVFADDWLFPECIEKMVTVAEEQPSVGIIGAYSLQGRRVMWVGLPYPSPCVSGRDLCRQFFLDQLYIFGSPTTVLYRADLVRSRTPFFNEANIHADTEAVVAALKTWDFGFVHQVLTFTRERPGSLSAVSTELNTHVAGMLHAIVAYGADYLTPQEFKLCLDRHLRGYYDFLGKSLMLGRDKSFWAYHKQVLIDADAGFSRSRLAVATLVKLCNAVLNPKDTFSKLLNTRRSGVATEHSHSYRSAPTTLSRFDIL